MDILILKEMNIDFIMVAFVLFSFKFTTYSNIYYYIVLIKK